MTYEEHKARHELLHKCLDEPAADMIRHTERTLTGTSVMELIEWSNIQTMSPSGHTIHGEE